jgi:CheY-like chemotaxis protein
VLVSAALVLVIDDDSSVRETLRSVLEEEGFRTATARDGADALAWLRTVSELPTVILLDLMMPVMDGWAFRAAQRRDARLAAIPTIVLTAHAEGRRAGIDVEQILKKPVSLEHLLATLEEYAPRRS